MTDRVVNHLLTPFCAGPQAVTLFFILSGFVLSLPALNSRAQTYTTFVVRRIFRIYFPYLFAITLGILGAAFFHGTVTGSDWFNSSWTGPLQWRLVAYHVLFVGVYNTMEFDNSIWSLVHEMRVSLIFPFLCAFVLRFRSVPVLIGALLLSVASSMVWIMPWTGPVSSYIETAHYAMFFVVGILIARELPSLSSRFKQLSHRARMLFVAVALTCFVYGQHAILTFALQSGHPIEAVGIAEWITALGAAGLIIASLNADSIRRVLLLPLIQSLGKMSYSIYLLHMIVMLFLVHTLYPRMPLLVIFATSFACTLALSWICYTKIEVPFNTLGHRLTRRSMSPDPIGPTAVSRENACGIEEEVVTASESANQN